MTYASDQGVLNAQWNAAEAAFQTEMERQRPFMMLRPPIYPCGDQWCVLLGEDLQVGICGFGDTPELAARAFDDAWRKSLTPQAMVNNRKLAPKP